MTMPSSRVVQEAMSAGGVVYRKEEGRLMIVLCGRTRPRTWNLPKGTPDPGENVEQTALREVKEETGLDVEIERPLGDIEYYFSRGIQRFHKRVHFYLMGERGGSFDEHDPEFDVVKWFPAVQAVHTLTFETEAVVVRRAIEALSARDGSHG
jgi:8-oxo-dGTP pyrophosphatase MutT (NUDIX family)